MKMEEFSWMDPTVRICSGWGCGILLLTDITRCIFALCNLLRPCGLAYEITGCPKFGVSVKESVLGSLLRVCGRTVPGLLTQQSSSTFAFEVEPVWSEHVCEEHILLKCWNVMIVSIKSRRKFHSITVWLRWAGTSGGLCLAQPRVLLAGCWFYSVSGL